MKTTYLSIFVFGIFSFLFYPCQTFAGDPIFIPQQKQPIIQDYYQQQQSQQQDQQEDYYGDQQGQDFYGNDEGFYGDQGQDYSGYGQETEEQARQRKQQEAQQGMEGQTQEFMKGFMNDPTHMVPQGPDSGGSGYDQYGQ